MTAGGREVERSGPILQPAVHKASMAAYHLYIRQPLLIERLRRRLK